MLVDDFDFDLPRESIAQRPVSPRDSARLMVVDGDGDDTRVSDLPGLLNPGDLLVFNDTRVIPARLKGKRGEASVEVTLHKRLNDDSWVELLQDSNDFGTDEAFDDYSKATWDHNLQTQASGVLPLSLPIPEGVDPYELIEPCSGSEDGIPSTSSCTARWSPSTGCRSRSTRTCCVP